MSLVDVQRACDAKGRMSDALRCGGIWMPLSSTHQAMPRYLIARK